jgi:Zn-dependent alcohol dehydrogenase
MTTPARVVVLPQEDRPLEIVEMELPDPEPFQVVVKQFASGICHSQLHQMHQQRAQPVLLGHESTGIVVQCGNEVSHVKAGDTVMVTWVPRDAINTSRAPVAASLQLPDGSTAQSQNVA